MRLKVLYLVSVLTMFLLFNISKESLSLDIDSLSYEIEQQILKSKNTDSIYNIDKHLQYLLDQKHYFTLRNEFNRTKDSLHRKSFLYFSAFLENAFLHPEASNIAIQSLLTELKTELSDSTIARLLIIQEDNYVKLFQYKNACSTAKTLVGLYQHVLDSAIIGDENNNIDLWCSLSSVDPQTIIIKKDSKIPYTRNSVNLLNIPVKISGNSCDFMFDTGADICVLRKSYSEKLKLRFLNSTINVKGTTGKNNSSELAIADSIQIGDIVLQNVVFLILPDEKLTFPQINLEINGIIGFPVIHQLKELRFSKDGFLTVPVIPTKSSLRNLALSTTKTIVQLTSTNDTLHFRFDTGANGSELYSKYYELHKADFEKNAISDTLTYGSLGETSNIKIFKIMNFSINFKGNIVILPYISVFTKDLREEYNMFYGCIGQDFISLFNEMIINYEDMFIDFN
jgi:hypothetical protein